ncbi:TVP38/TMEM64 family protein [Sporosarcina sp. PTS2304]|uniref:TVP38/TMEM64 family protein n=1 Tax=Sporosarcina sp. PTS2304 TaxID=2283194 RepID=UPI000E0CFBAD|nr:TVP38/TMEM64 family protein [Sporosarcina sp. PTS2304]AXH98492.1 TVP38/TMEM64 family protein [Sporosarcina sp. PTS2304]
MNEWLSIDKVEELANQYEALGFFMGLLPPFLEAFLPFLPLVVFVIANALAFGFWYGFILSWAGTVAGSYAVFLLIRKYGGNRFFSFLTRPPRVQQLIHWVERNGFGPLFILICFPFTPSALVNLVAGLSNMNKKNYLFALMLGKLVMIMMITFIGYDIRALFTQPIRTLIMFVVIFLLWLVGKWFERRLTKKVEDDFKSFSSLRSADKKE